MRYILGDHWRDIFDAVMVNAKKPRFFTHRLRHFREFHPGEGTLSWDEVAKFEKGKVYARVRQRLN